MGHAPYLPRRTFASDLVVPRPVKDSEPCRWKPSSKGAGPDDAARPPDQTAGNDGGDGRAPGQGRRHLGPAVDEPPDQSRPLVGVERPPGSRLIRLRRFTSRGYARSTP